MLVPLQFASLAIDVLGSIVAISCGNWLEGIGSGVIVVCLTHYYCCISIVVVVLATFNEIMVVESIALDNDLLLLPVKLTGSRFNLLG